MALSSRQWTILTVAISAVAVMVMIGSLWPREPTLLTDSDRASHIASRLRCPFCGGESIADATSQVARDLKIKIDEQVTEGMSDDEIYQYFSDRYGESLLLSPPLFGWGWALWVIPTFGFAIGLIAVVRRRKGLVVIPASQASESRGALEARLEAVVRDQADIARQLATGELDADLSFSLTANLAEEEVAIEAALASGVSSGGRSLVTSRVVGGVAILTFSAIAITAMLIFRGSDGTESGVVDAPPIDLASVSIDRMEEVIAENPDIIEMRIFLAQMLVEEGEVLRAAHHFNEVLKYQEHPEAMAWLGWISYLAGEYETAEAFLVNALALAPDYPQAQWWLATVRFLGLNDPSGASSSLEILLSSDGVPDDVRAAAQEMLDLAREQGL